MTIGFPIKAAWQPLSIAQLQTNYLARQLGIFLHFSMATFCDTEVPASNQNPNTFNPIALDFDQIIRQVVIAKATYAVWTIKHEDGWCNWNTATTTYNMTNSVPAFGNYGDIAKLFVASCRRYNVIPVFYYCMHDNWFEANNPGFTQAAYKSYAQAQLLEITQNYGWLGGIWIDAANTATGFPSMGYPWNSSAELVAYVNTLQNFLCINNAQHNLPPSLTESNIAEYEGANLPGEFVQAGNTDPAECCETVYDNGSPSSWFWKSTNPALRSTSTLISNIALANSRTSNYLINFPPDNTGQIPSNFQTVIAAIGAR